MGRIRNLLLAGSVAAVLGISWLSTQNGQFFENNETESARCGVSISGLTASRRVDFKGPPLRSWQGKLLSFDNDPHPSIDKCSKLSMEERQKTLVGVLTTILGPQDSVRAFGRLLPNNKVIVVGDRKGPFRYEVPEANLLFLNVTQQESVKLVGKAIVEFGTVIPWNHFGRKNLGYLKAIELGACLVWDFDDDNVFSVSDLAAVHRAAVQPRIPKTEFDGLFGLRVRRQSRGQSWPRSINPYAVLGPNSRLWPRGFPPEDVNSRIPNMEPELVRFDPSATENIAVIQSAAEIDPDVDAMYRLTQPTPHAYFDSPIHAAYVGYPYLAPYNAQATLHTSIAYWALYLPITVHGRVSDIWRSYIAQSIFHVCGFLVGFTEPWVNHNRTAHDWIGDLRAESDLYDSSAGLIAFLGEWTDRTIEGLNGRAGNPLKMLQEVYVLLYERGIVQAADVRGVQAWIKALREIRYQPPSDQCRPRDYVRSPSPKQTFNEVGVAVQINDGKMRAVAPWNAIWGSALEGNLFYNVIQTRKQSACRAMTDRIKCHYNVPTGHGGLAPGLVAETLAQGTFSEHIKRIIWQRDDVFLDYFSVLKSFEHPYCFARPDNWERMSRNSSKLGQQKVMQTRYNAFHHDSKDLFDRGAGCRSGKDSTKGNDGFWFSNSSSSFAIDIRPRCSSLVTNLSLLLQNAASHGLDARIALPTAASCAAPGSSILQVPASASKKPAILDRIEGVVEHLLQRDKLWEN